MKKLLPKLLFLSAFAIASYVLILYFLFFHTSYENPGDYMSAILDKIELLRKTPSPKMVFIGGSNLAFGLDSERIQKELGLPVINMGLHANTGVKFMFNCVKPYIGPGDVIVLIPEYQQFYENYFYGREHLLNMFNLFPEYVTSPEQYIVISKYGGLFIRKKLFLPIDRETASNGPIYNRKAFNKFGDVVSHLGRPDDVDHSKYVIESINKTVPLKYEDGFNDNTLYELDNFIRYVQQRKGKFVFSFPCLKESAYHQGPELTVYDIIKNHGIRVYSTPEDYVFPDSYFFDTEYHLNAYGRKVRTEKVISELKKALKNSADLDIPHTESTYLAALTGTAKKLFSYAMGLGGHDNTHYVEIAAQRIKEVPEPFPKALNVDLITTTIPPLHVTFEGFGTLEGPYAQWNLPRVRWVREASAKIEIKDVTVCKTMKLALSFCPHVRPFAGMAVRFNNKDLKTYYLKGENAWKQESIDIPLQKGTNTIEFIDLPLPGQPPPQNSLYMLFRVLSLRVES